MVSLSDLWSSLTNAVEGHYNYSQLAQESDALARNRYADLGQQDAFQHAYVSALLALRHSLTESKLLGDAREAWTTYQYYTGKDKDYRTDTYRDLYNNAVGRAIGAYARQNSLSESEVADLVNHAVSSGQTISSIRYSDPDPRLPYIDSYTDPNSFRLTPRAGLFNGWPGDFPNIPNIWTPPQTGGGLSNQSSQADETAPQSAVTAGSPRFDGSGMLSGRLSGGILDNAYPTW